MTIMETQGLDFRRQIQLFDPSKQSVHINIIGVGSVGSFLTLTLAKLGCRYIRVFDGDCVEAHNIPNQFYRLQDIGKPKTVALFDIVKDFTGREISYTNDFLKTVETQIPVEQDMIVIFALDSIEERRKLAQQLQGWPVIVIDPRMGGEGWQLHTANFMKDDEYNSYMDTLQGKPRHLPCGAQTIIYTILSISSEVSRIVKAINQEQPIPKIVKREMSKYLFISDVNEN